MDDRDGALADMALRMADSDPMPEANPSARNLVPLDVLAKLGRRSDRRGVLRLAAHIACIGATGCLVWLARAPWLLLIPAMALHGVTIVTLFAPMHECVHRTAFASRWANDAVGWIAGVLSFYNATYYWHFHAWHHRYTQDPERDPELIFPKAKNRRAYLTAERAYFLVAAHARLSAAGARLGTRPAVCAGGGAACDRAVDVGTIGDLFGRGGGVGSASWRADLLVYSGRARAAVSARAVRRRAHRLHPGRRRPDQHAHDAASFPIRLLMWNMPFHAEHHLYPAIPFHHFPALYGQVRDRLEPRAELSRRQSRHRPIPAGR